MSVTYFDLDLVQESMQEKIYDISVLLTERAFSSKHNPVVQRSTGKDKLKILNRFTEQILTNLISYWDKEILVEFF